MKWIASVLLALALSGCGSSSTKTTTTTFAATTTTAAPSGPAKAAGGGTVLYESTEWAVVVKGGTAVALHRTGSGWRPDRSGRVKVVILGPSASKPQAAIPQVAAELSSSSALAESALWVDGVELQEKGGGLTPKRGTIYSAPTTPLAPGKHVAVAYARTAVSATAVARVFTVG